MDMLLLLVQALFVAPVLSAAADVCPGAFDVGGIGRMELVPTGWGGPASPVSVAGGDTLVPHMGGRAYFAEHCTAGKYDHTQYSALKLLGKTLRYTTDMSGAGCGCNAAFYLVSMRQNDKPSTCHDFYCDANSVCGVPCSEIDIQEANQHAWHSTLHSSTDRNGLGLGYGGGDGWNGPRDFGPDQYGPGAACIDTTNPFDVSVSFPVDGSGQLAAMEVVLEQEGKNCPLKLRVQGYAGMAELTHALSEGMTPVVSYWASDSMLWMDGKGADGRGPCAVDAAKSCPSSVRFYGFEVFDIGMPAVEPPPQVQVAVPTRAPAPVVQRQCPGSVSVRGLGQVSVISAKVNVPSQRAGRVEVSDKSAVLPFMKGRGYFGRTCSPGSYSNTDYLGLQLLGKRLRYVTDMSGAGCGCNAALYLVSMRQNARKSQCGDHYCDANNVCGESCTEIDIQEANQKAWHSTLHASSDHAGTGVGFGGGNGWNGPRDFGAADYGPGSRCIDTARPFTVEASFPQDSEGGLKAMEVVLSQDGSPCSLRMSIGEYASMPELTKALADGMTPVLSYWAADDMTWLDGQGKDGLGPCTTDHAASCSESVRFSNFSVEVIAAAPKGAPKAAPTPAPTTGPTCPGRFNISGWGQTSLVPTGWNANGAPVQVVGGRTLVPHMGSRAYFSTTCTAGKYDHTQYLSMNLLGKTLAYTVDLSDAGCGCNAALYLVSMRQNDKPSTCHDYYCDANHVCGVSCAEIDIQEASMYAWHSTLHSPHDHAGKGAGYGGGDGWTGPRDFSGAEYGPGGKCIDTRRPFRVAASFPVDGTGRLQAMHVKLTQDGCSLTAAVTDYDGMDSLSDALRAGMTPVMSYWSANDMLWMDGRGSDGLGPCAVDDAAACGEAVRFSDFALLSIGGHAAPPSSTPAPAPAPPPAKQQARSEHKPHTAVWAERCTVVGEDCQVFPCCEEPVVRCEKVNNSATCRLATDRFGKRTNAERLDSTLMTLDEADTFEDAGKASTGGSVVLRVRVPSARLPRHWTDRERVVVDFGDAKVAGHVLGHTEVVEMTDVQSPHAILTVVCIAAVAALLVLVCRKWYPAAKAWLVKERTMASRSARPLSLRFGELIQESPLRRRSAVTPAADETSQSIGHVRWPSDLGALNFGATHGVAAGGHADDARRTL